MGSISVERAHSHTSTGTQQSSATDSTTVSSSSMDSAGSTLLLSAISSADVDAATTPATSVSGSSLSSSPAKERRLMTANDARPPPTIATHSPSASLSTDPPLPPPIDTASVAKEAAAAAVPAVALVDKHVQRRLRLYRALMELVETERSYADDLAILVMVFFENLQRMPFFGASGDLAEQAWRYETVSRNAEQLLRLHQQIAVQLEAIVARNGLNLSSSATQAVHSDQAATAEETEKAMSQGLDVAVINVARYFVTIVSGARQTRLNAR